jgi:hypothetical protein
MAEQTAVCSSAAMFIKFQEYFVSTNNGPEMPWKEWTPLVAGDRLLSHPSTLHTSLMSAPITNLDHKDKVSVVVTKYGTTENWSGGTDVNRWRGE